MNELTLFVKYTAKPGMRERFVRTLVEKGIVTAIRNEAGCICYDYYFSAQDENVVLLVEKWESAEHQRVHMTQPHMAEVKTVKEQFVADTAFGDAALR
ncbi:MAG: antibiotic biosynthesis monooxygenase [Clostridiales bacterium]|nr:antibiotic biosynthesis monooxygenase [Candidatus Cacconaster stercorequi]